MTHVRLDAPDGQHARPQAWRQQHCGDGANLNRIAQRRAIRRSLNQLQLCRCCASVGEHRSQQQLLRPAIGRRQTRATPILAHRTAHNCTLAHHSSHHAHTTAFASDKAICTRVKHKRLARRRRQSCSGVAVERGRYEHHIDARDQRVATLVQLQCRVCALHRHKRRRARNVDRLTRAVQPKHVRQPSSHNAVPSTRHGVRIRLRQSLAELGGHHANKHGRVALHELAPCQRRAMQRLVPQLKHEPLLGVHCARLRWRDAKRRVVEEFSAPQKGAVPHCALRTSICPPRGGAHAAGITTRRGKAPCRREPSCT